MTYFWYRPKWHIITLILLPFSWLFGLCTTIRRWLYRKGIMKKHQFPVPVIVVGNITVGGTGKTPFVIWLSTWLRAQGYYPGIVSRGVGGKKHSMPYRVNGHDIPAEVGDEAVLLKKRTDCPVVICVNRAAAVRDLLQYAHCDIVISDDGLQHYSLTRDIEIALVNTERGMGNHCLLPAGPLREPRSRLQEMDFVVYNGEELAEGYAMSYLPTELISLTHPQQTMPLADFANKAVHAIAGIGHPERFFSMLRNLGLKVIPHSFPDHYLYRAEDIHFADSLPVIMTEKDAVKCSSFADERFWYLSITAKINAKLEQALLSRILSVLSSQTTLAKRH